MNQENDLIGEAVQIRIDHQETPCKGLDVIVGTLYGTVRDQDGELYWIVNTEARQQTEAEAEPYLSASRFVVTPKAWGDTLRRAHLNIDDEVPVVIGYFLDEPALDSDPFDFSQTRFFAIGYLGFTGNRHT